MPNRKTRPTSPGRRFGTYPMREELSGDQPAKSLTKGKTSSGGRNSGGRVTSRHRGGGAKRRYRRIDFKRTKDGVPARVASIEYDPNRSASIALVNYADGVGVADLVGAAALLVTEDALAQLTRRAKGERA